MNTIECYIGWCGDVPLCGIEINFNGKTARLGFYNATNCLDATKELGEMLGIVPTYTGDAVEEFTS